MRPTGCLQGLNQRTCGKLSAQCLGLYSTRPCPASCGLEGAVLPPSSGRVGWLGEQVSAEVAVMQGRSAGPLGVTPGKGARVVFCVYELWWEELRDPPSCTCGAWAGWV